MKDGKGIRKECPGTAGGRKARGRPEPDGGGYRRRHRETGHGAADAKAARRCPGSPWRQDGRRGGCRRHERKGRQPAGGRGEICQSPANPGPAGRKGRAGSGAVWVRPAAAKVRRAARPDQDIVPGPPIRRRIRRRSRPAARITQRAALRHGGYVHRRGSRSRTATGGCVLPGPRAEPLPSRQPSPYRSAIRRTAAVSPGPAGEFPHTGGIPPGLAEPFRIRKNRTAVENPWQSIPVMAENSSVMAGVLVPGKIRVLREKRRVVRQNPCLEHTRHEQKIFVDGGCVGSGKNPCFA